MGILLADYEGKYNYVNPIQVSIESLVSLHESISLDSPCIFFINQGSSLKNKLTLIHQVKPVCFLLVHFKCTSKCKEHHLDIHNALKDLPHIL